MTVVALSTSQDRPLALSENAPPANLEAEQALLGALLHHNGAYEQLCEYLKPEHFADATNGRIYAAMGRLIERGQIADPITLRDFFSRDKSLDDIGGTEYLAYLATCVISLGNTQTYGKIIHELALRRALIDLGSQIAQEAITPTSEEETPQRQIEKAEQRLYDLATTGQSDRGFVAFSGALATAIQAAQLARQRQASIVGVTTGLEDLDKQLGGLHPSDLIILAGRPSMGKTALATNIAFNAALAKLEDNEGPGAGVAFFSLEMSADQLAGRLLAQESDVPSDHIRRGQINDTVFPRFRLVAERCANLPLYIDDTPALTISAVRTRSRRLKRKHGLGLIIIDYLQLLQGSNGGKEGRVQEISEITRGLKALAKELNVPVIALSQLSRAVEQRDDKRPQLSDLRESGSIEQDADVVIFVYREEYYLARQEPSDKGGQKYLEWETKMTHARNVGEAIISKQRHGPIGTVRLYFDASLTRFGNLKSKEHLPDARY
ncbi:MAG: replicative DNA helicase [Alphaproteobacteria bacterium]|jgi:replicative DNA helicase|nr:replicative DNA helicase [Alphaproteobacteria bacterium]